jgi:hypothetical protein
VASTDLLFRQAPLAQPAALLFGEVESLPDVSATLAATLPPLTVALHLMPVAEVTLAATLPPLTVALHLMPVAEVTLAAALPPLTVAVNLMPVAEVTLAAAMPDLTVAIIVTRPIQVTLAATMPDLTVTAQAVYSSGAARPLVGQVATQFQTAARVDGGATAQQQNGQRMRGGVGARYETATPAPTGATSRFQNGQRKRASAAARHQEAVPLKNAAASGYANMLRTLRPAFDAAWREADGRHASAATAWQERYRDRRPTLRSAWQEAQRVLRQVGSSSGEALPLQRRWDGRYQEAMVPPPGTAGTTPTPARETCYTPPAGNAVFLLFADPPGGSDLVFVCERHVGPGATVVVPVKRVYMVVNNTTLSRVVGDTLVPLPTYSMSLSLDVDSWTWGFSAALPTAALAQLQPDEDGMPAELVASINGQSFRVLAEQLSRERQFGRDAIRITGRGKNAILDAPYAPVQEFINTEERLAQQLMNDALTVGGVSIGWDVDFRIDDWLVPANVWAAQGSYIGAVTNIAAAVGAYVQPHPTDNTLIVMHRYPFAPWEWGDVTPDYELPSAVTTQESIEWARKAGYNAVYVSGTSDGVLGQVTRTGTAGDLLAPMVSDPLITEAVAARQRGRAVLSDTGRIAHVTLRLPVLSETGIIMPGKFVRYVDGEDTMLGIVRSTGVDVKSNGSPDVWQNILVETHP